LHWHCSPSAVVQQALAQLSPTRPQDISIPTDISQLRQFIREELATMQASLIPQLIREELAAIQATQTPVTAVVTVTPTETSAQLQPDTGQLDVTETVTETVTEAATETVTVTEPSSQVRAYGEVPAGILAVLAQRQSATAAELAKALGDSTKAGTKAVWQALQRLLKRGEVIREGQQYRLPA
jgi:carbohydrate-binding DOMON domain-containing protein